MAAHRLGDILLSDILLSDILLGDILLGGGVVLRTHIGGQ